MLVFVGAKIDLSWKIQRENRVMAKLFCTQDDERSSTRDITALRGMSCVGILILILVG